MKAVVLREVGRPTAVEELALRPLRGHEVRVRLHASGVCHSDLSLRDGAIPTLLPSTLGHEGAGIVADSDPASEWREVLAKVRASVGAAYGAVAGKAVA